jgi:hypothetical protein
MKIVKSQITKPKSQINSNDQNSKFQTFGTFQNWDLEFIWYLLFGAWNFRGTCIVIGYARRFAKED